MDRLRDACAVSRDGAQARNILLAARGYGMEAKGYKMEPENLRKLNVPCILHWNLCHYVVLCGFQGNYAIINDPAAGKIKVSKAEFNASFTGVVLLLTPIQNFVVDGQ